jgi:hypothetical protein
MYVIDPYMGSNGNPIFDRAWVRKLISWSGRTDINMGRRKPHDSSAETVCVWRFG